jgi:CheY-like chemotaxis protein
MVLDVATAVDGKDGLVKLKADPGIKLVVSDVNMPNMDGLTMVEKIRGELGNATVNVIMLTTESSPSMKGAVKPPASRLDRQAIQRRRCSGNIQEARWLSARPRAIARGAGLERGQDASPYALLAFLFS